MREGHRSPPVPGPSIRRRRSRRLTIGIALIGLGIVLLVTLEWWFTFLDHEVAEQVAGNLPMIGYLAFSGGVVTGIVGVVQPRGLRHRLLLIGATLVALGVAMFLGGDAAVAFAPDTSPPEAMVILQLMVATLLVILGVGALVAGALTHGPSGRDQWARYVD